MAGSWFDVINICGEGVSLLDAFRSLIGADESGDLFEAGNQRAYRSSGFYKSDTPVIRFSGRC